MPKIKICYILPFYEEGTDTHLFYNYGLIKKLAAQSESDMYIILEKKKEKPNFGAKYYEQKYSFPLFRLLELFFKCLSLRIKGYKNYYVHYSYYGALAAWLSGGRVFYWNRGMPWLFKRGWLEEKVFRFILRHTILVTGPESLAKEYQKRYGVKEYRVLSNWVDIERFKPKPLVLQGLAQSDGSSRAIREHANMRAVAKFGGEAEHIVLFVHHLSKRKGADLIPEIAKGFGDDTLFLIVGDGPERANLEKCGLGKVKVLGKIPNSEIPKYLQSADVFLMPSREEGSPHVILEAMASGTPFVASEVGGVRELVPGPLESFLCKSEDIKCFQEKIKLLLEDKNIHEKAKNECLNYAKNFDIKRGIDEFINLFK